MFKAFLFHNGFRNSTRTPTPKFPFPFSLKFCTTTTTTTTDPNPFVVSYLINNCGFSPESARKASNQVYFKTSQKPDSVFAFFRTHGFSDSNTRSIIRREPWLLSCDTQKRVFSKFQFLSSKGASPSDIARIVTRNPRFLRCSLEKIIIPTYDLVSEFLQSDEETLCSVMHHPHMLDTCYFMRNVNLLVDNGVARLNIERIIRTQARVIYSTGLEKTVQELKDLGFDPSKVYFRDALMAKKCLGESQWSEKVGTFKSWGWSEEMVAEAFRRQPLCMLQSSAKINRVMRFWVDQLGWSSSYLVKGPGIIGYSLEKRVVPRASVVHRLISEGLRDKSASLLTPFFMSEKLFLKRFVECFEKEEAEKLLKLYHEKMNLK